MAPTSSYTAISVGGPTTSNNILNLSCTSPMVISSADGGGTGKVQIGRRITEMAERYGETPDSALATELFGAERTLFATRRSLDRARGLLEDMA